MHTQQLVAAQHEQMVQQRRLLHLLLETRLASPRADANAARDALQRAQPPPPPPPQPTPQPPPLASSCANAAPLTRQPATTPSDPMAAPSQGAAGRSPPFPPPPLPLSWHTSTPTPRAANGQAAPPPAEPRAAATEPDLSNVHSNLARARATLEALTTDRAGAASAGATSASGSPSWSAATLEALATDRAALASLTSDRTALASLAAAYAEALRRAQDRGASSDDAARHASSVSGAATERAREVRSPTADAQSPAPVDATEALRPPPRPPSSAAAQPAMTSCGMCSPRGEPVTLSSHVATNLARAREVTRTRSLSRSRSRSRSRTLTLTLTLPLTRALGPHDR